eukprot:CAMPEP_0117756894 /NCGR_PEP_ID=MMETSP0947-20121206/14377_1 /TAXON_ID=44440 /ORGANISM="Chattonella subsalsa, Strain CCMP2191" /LENGTH=185 /DNA_ID=CAMNT_0005576623 /DNA_START=58 /DNA_END=615 /DNA_ORIENTATION=+
MNTSYTTDSKKKLHNDAMNFLKKEHPDLYNAVLTASELAEVKKDRVLEKNVEDDKEPPVQSKVKQEHAKSTKKKGNPSPKQLERKETHLQNSWKLLAMGEHEDGRRRNLPDPMPPPPLSTNLSLPILPWFTNSMMLPPPLIAPPTLFDIAQNRASMFGPPPFIPPEDSALAWLLNPNNLPDFGKF